MPDGTQQPIDYTTQMPPRPGSTPPPGTGTPPPGTGTPPPGTGTPPPAGGGFGLSYQDYLSRYHGADQSAFSESGGSGLPDLISQDQWNAMTPAQQWAALGGVDSTGFALPGSANHVTITPDDPRYAALAQQTGVSNGQPIEIFSGANHPGDASWWRDPNAVTDIGNGMFATPSGNFTQNAYNVANQSDLGFQIVQGLVAAAWGAAGYDAFTGGGLTGATAADVPVDVSTTDLGALGTVGGEGAPAAGLDVSTTDLGALGTVGGEGAPAATPLDISTTDLGGLGTAGGTDATSLGDLGIDASPIGTSSLSPTPSMVDPATFADNLTPDINDLVGGFPGGGNDIVLQPPPEVPATDLMPDINIQQPGLLDSFTSGLENAITKDPLRALGTAATVGNLIAGGRRSGVPSGFSNNVNANAPLGTQARNTLLNNGAPTPDQRTAIDSSIDQEWRIGREQIIQASINSGQGGENSMVVQDKLRSFRMQLETQRQTLYLKQADQNMLIALKELGLVDEQQYQLAQLQLNDDKLTQQRAMSIMQSLGWLWSQHSGGSGGTSGTGGTGGGGGTGG